MDVRKIRPQILVKLIELKADPTIQANGMDCLARAASQGCFEAVVALLSTDKFDPWKVYQCEREDGEIKEKNLGELSHFCSNQMENWLWKTYSIARKHGGL